MYKNYYWLNEESRIFLKRDYLSKGETPEQRIRDIAENAEKILKIDGFADKFEGFMKKGYYSLATPCWVNFGNKRGYPVSCFGSFIEDDTESIFDKLSEIGVMTKGGGGTSAYFGELRPRGSKISSGGESDGPVRFMEMFDSVTKIISQGSARRGTMAAYLPIDHPDIKEFLAIKSDGHPIQALNIGVTVSDEWMKSMVDGDSDKRKVWGKVIQKRFESGYPYIFFSDTVNKNKPQIYKDRDLRIYASNVCSEITLPSTSKESFVCVLSSINLLHWDEIKKTDAVETLLYFLDAVNEEFIVKTSDKKFMEAPHNFAKNHRALGLGVLGWHSLLQSKSIAFESMEAKFLNTEIHKTIKVKCDIATRELAQKYGETQLLKGTGRRNATVMTLAPTTSSSFILGQVSQSIEPLNSNYFVKKLAKGNFTYKNPHLKQLLIEKNKDTKEAWEEILKNGGSVQKLDFLSEHEKDVFKTFVEISQKEIVIQAIQRQKYIDQSQSLNLMIHPKTSPKEVSQLLIYGWENGIKTFYYQRGCNPAQELGRNLLQCKSCEG
jgi:ribonucleoside-diphosphate reductase alpha chain